MAFDPKQNPDTLIQHLGEEDHVMGAVVPPLFQNSLFVFKSLDEFRGCFTTDLGCRHHYSRVSNPTLDLLESKLAALEGTERAKVFGSGMAAISAVIMACSHQGSHVVCADTVYGPTKMLLEDYLTKFGVSVTFVDARDTENVLQAVRPETSLIFLESPTSFFFYLQDLDAIGKFARSRGIATAIDNSYSSPLLQNPATLGIDYVIHSASKYISGHSDIIAGVVCCDADRMNSLLHKEVSLFGGIAAPYIAWMLTRSLRTLPLRMKAAESNGNSVATWLRDQPDVDVVHHVGFSDFPQAELRDKQMKGSGGLFSFEPTIQSDRWVKAFTEALNLFRLGVSWGGHESLVVPLLLQPIGYPSPRWVVRLYTGLEDPQDLISDLDQALTKASTVAK
ncbi:MAG: PLP-dependent aspartate aminotransferase family protein [Fimbriimonadaceae bacterium]|jgi:cystathionine beta-lyase/cystathionine gamma-synthase|nr:PLP-dependent aspartate aminotransferase family protein [Fimbriimonadaceae bacterium]